MAFPWGKVPRGAGGGERRPDLPVNGSAHTFKILFDFQVGKAQDSYFFNLLQIGCPNLILLRTIPLIMLGAVQFNG